MNFKPTNSAVQVLFWQSYSKEGLLFYKVETFSSGTALKGHPRLVQYYQCKSVY